MASGLVRSIVAVGTVLVMVAVVTATGAAGEEEGVHDTVVQRPDGTISTSGSRTVSPTGRLQLPRSGRPAEHSEAREREQKAAQAQSVAANRYTTPEGPGAQLLNSRPTIPQAETPRPRRAAPEAPVVPPGQKVPDRDLREFMPQAPSDVVVTKHSLAAGPNRLHLNEPSASENRQGFFWAPYNLHVGRSLNGGSTWDFIDPAGVSQINGMSVCCHQDTIYDPSRDLTVWAVQYAASPTAGNAVRVIIFDGAQQLANLSFDFYDFTAETHCGGNDQDGDWLDRPQLALGNDNLYVAINAFRSLSAPISPGGFRCTTMLRLPIQTLKNAGLLTYSFHSEGHTDTGQFFSFTPVQGATSTMYWAHHLNNTTMRVYSWPESSTAVPTFTDVAHASYPTGSHTCTVTASGRNPCALDDDRHATGWLGEGVLGWMWDAPQGSSGLGTFTFPHVRFIRLNETTKAVLEDAAIFANNFGWLLPSVGVNGRGHIGGTIMAAGGSLEPGCVAFVDDELKSAFLPFDNYLVSFGDSSGPQNGWGLYSRTRRGGQVPNQWIGACYTYEGGTLTPWVTRFGRERDIIRPANDAFASPTNITGTLPQVRNESTANATGQFNEPQPCGIADASVWSDASVWFTWTAPATKRYQVKTVGSTYDTQLAVYTGTAIDALTPVGCHDNINPGTTSHLNFDATIGTVYRIQVDGNAGQTGNLVLTIEESDGCTPRPRVAVTTTLPGGNRLGVTITVGSQNVGNKLLTIRFGPDSHIPTPNVLLDLPGIGNDVVPSGQVLGVPGTPVTYSFFVRRQTAGVTATVPFTVTDQCGEWKSFVGGGTSAGF
jgi:hypothetical protein